MNLTHIKKPMNYMVNYVVEKLSSKKALDFVEINKESATKSLQACTCCQQLFFNSCYEGKKFWGPEKFQC